MVAVRIRFGRSGRLGFRRCFLLRSGHRSRCFQFRFWLFFTTDRYGVVAETA